MSSPAELKYTKSHEWVRVDGDTATIGVTAPGVGDLTGVVTFMDGAATLGTATVVDGAKALAMTTLDYFASAELRTAARAEFEKSSDLSRSAVASAYHKDGILLAGGCGCC